jgi:hypothetical protein
MTRAFQAQEHNYKTGAGLYGPSLSGSKAQFQKLALLA